MHKLIIKKGDFVELEYTGKLKEGNVIFDTTDENAAKDNKIHQEGKSYGSVIICVGENQIIKGLDKELEGNETERTYTLELEPEDAFGKKDTKLIQLISTSKFLKHNIQPIPGLQVNIDGVIGIVKSVSGGRTLVDFNHPLAGKTVIYDVKVDKIVREDEKKLKSYLKLSLDIEDAKIEIEGNKAKIQLKQEIPAEIQKKIEEKITSIMPNIQKIDFLTDKK